MRKHEVNTKVANKSNELDEKRGYRYINVCSLVDDCYFPLSLGLIETFEDVSRQMRGKCDNFLAGVTIIDTNLESSYPYLSENCRIVRLI